MLTQSDFDYARAHPKTWKEFVRAVEREYASPYIARITYATRQPLESKAATDDGRSVLMQCEIDIIESIKLELGVGYPRSKITIYPDTFDKIQSLDTFMLGLDHENQHAKDFLYARHDPACDTAIPFLASVVDVDTEIEIDGRHRLLDDILMDWRIAWFEFNAYSAMIANERGRKVPPEFMEDNRTQVDHFSRELAQYRAMFSENPVLKGLRKR